MAREILGNYDEEQLFLRQQQFAALLSSPDQRISPEQLLGLRFCRSCGGDDYQWTDWGMENLGGTNGFIETEEEAWDYRGYLTDTRCDDCEGTGFQGGSWDLEPAGWVELAAGRLMV